MSVGLRLLASLIDSEKGLDQYARLRLDESMFMGEAELELYRLAARHVTEYGKLPSRSTCKEQGILTVPAKQPEPPKYYFDKLRERYVFYRLKDMLHGVEADLNDDKPNKALSSMSDVMSMCQLFMQRDRIFDFRADGLETVMGDFRRKLLMGDDHGMRMGWPTLDTMSGGLGAGDLLSIVGRPGMGKTYLMMHGANHAWLSGHTPLFISMEMKPLLVMQRAAAMLARLPITGIKHAALETHQQAKLQNYLIKNKQAKVPYWIVDGALTATVDDILLLAAQLNPSAVFIDGAYLLRTKQRMPRWEKLTENAERIKGEIAEGLGVPTVISYQLNRESKKKGKGEPVGLEHIAYTDAIGQLSSIVLAQTEEESVETLIRKRVEIAKGRSGEQGHFNINWKFDQGPDYMNFDEILPPPKEEEQQDLGHI